MKTLILSAIFVLLSPSITKATSSNIETNINASSNGGTTEVRVNNQVNTGSNTTSVKGTTTTKVNINQNGGGTSSVTVNGKEYKVEGTGSLSIDETTDTNSSGSPTLKPTEPETPTQDKDENTDEDKSGFRKFFDSIKIFFSKLFGR